MVGALLRSPDAWAEVVPLVEAADFVDEGCAWCYEAAQSLADRGPRITMQTLAHELECAGRLDRLGGERGLAARLGAHLSDDDAHAGIVARDALYRRMIDADGQLARIASEAGPDQAVGSGSPTRCCSPTTRTATTPASPRPRRIPVHTRTARRRRSATALRLRRIPYQAARPNRTPHDHLAALRQRTGRRRFGNPLLRNGYPAPERAPHDHLAPPADTPARARPRRTVPAPPHAP